MSNVSGTVLAYAAKGYKVFPLQPNSKIPATSNGLYAATAAPDPKDFDGRNIGLVTGNGLVVIDVDTPKLDEESEAFVHEELNRYETYTVRTPSGGYHYYFSYPEPMRNRAGVLKGIDVRADGGYVVAPPSVIKGKVYKVVRDVAVLPLPPAVREILLVTKKAVNVNNGDVPEGGRNDWLTRAAGSMQRTGLLTLPGLQALNEERCNPPLEEREVETIYNSVVRYAPEQDLPAGAPPGDCQLVELRELIPAMIDYLRDSRRVAGEATCFPGLNRMLGGGFREGEVTAWCAEAKTGKNTVWHYIIYNWLKQTKPVSVGYASRELDPATEVAPDIFTLGSGRQVRKIGEKGHPEYLEMTRGWGDVWFHPGYGYFPPEEIRPWIEKLVAKNVKQIFFDHLHYMLDDPEDHRKASKLIKEIKTLAKEYKVSINLITQPNKQPTDPYGNKLKLTINSIKGGAAIGQAVDNILCLERHTEVPNLTEVRLDRCRSKLATPGTIYLNYFQETGEFEEWSKEETLKEIEEQRREKDRGPTYGND